MLDKHRQSKTSANGTAGTSYRDNDTSAESNLSVKSVARQTAVRADAGKVRFLWAVLQAAVR